MEKKERSRAARHQFGKISKMLDKNLSWMRKVQQLARLYTKDQETRLDPKEVGEEKASLEYCLLL